MPSQQHKHPPVSFRPGVKYGDPDGDRAWLLEYAALSGRPVSAVLAGALVRYRAEIEAATGRRPATRPSRTVRELVAWLSVFHPGAIVSAETREGEYKLVTDVIDVGSGHSVILLTQSPPT